jgi:hypothetical protein
VLKTIVIYHDFYKKLQKRCKVQTKNKRTKKTKTTRKGFVKNHIHLRVVGFFGCFGFLLGDIIIVQSVGIPLLLI